MAAAIAVFQSLVPGDHVVVARMLYWASASGWPSSAMTWGLDVEFVDTTDLDAVQAALRPGKTRLVWIETPANPTWDVTDIAAIAELAHAAGARVAVDYTVPTPVLTRPLALGADLVMHSATKYLNGHSDVLAGARADARATIRSGSASARARRTRRRRARAVRGLAAAARHAHAVPARATRARDSALARRAALRSHPALGAVLYPGLPSHPGHAIAARQMTGGFGGMLSIRVAGGAERALRGAGRASRCASARRRSAASRA